MKSIGASKFKAQCLSILDHLDSDGLVITKHGKPIAKLTPFPAGESNLIGSLKEHLEIRGDILSTGMEWEADSKS